MQSILYTSCRKCIFTRLVVYFIIINFCTHKIYNFTLRKLCARKGIHFCMFYIFIYTYILLNKKTSVTGQFVLNIHLIYSYIRLYKLICFRKLIMLMFDWRSSCRGSLNCTGMWCFILKFNIPLSYYVWRWVLRHKIHIWDDLY